MMSNHYSIIVNYSFTWSGNKIYSRDSLHCWLSRHHAALQSHFALFIRELIQIKAIFFVEDYQILLKITRIYQRLPTKYHQGFLMITTDYQGLPEYYKGLPGITGDYRGLQGIAGDIYGITMRLLTILYEITSGFLTLVACQICTNLSRMLQFSIINTFFVTPWVSDSVNRLIFSGSRYLGRFLPGQKCVRRIPLDHIKFSMNNGS